MQTVETGDWTNPRLCQSIKLVDVNGIIPRISSGPAAIGAAHKGRTYDCTRPSCTNAHKTPCQPGASAYDNAVCLFNSRFHRQLAAFRNVPFSNSSNACWSSCCVFITIGPYQATGSSSGFPETRRNRTPSSPACTSTSSPRSKRISERLSASDGGAVSSQPTPSVGTASGPDALQNFPPPANTYANAQRVVSTGRVFRRPGATPTSR